MGAFTEYAAGEIIKHIFRTGSFAKPAGLHVALYGEDGNELSGPGYGRVALPPADANWAAPTSGNGTTSNLAPVVYGVPTGDWGRATHFGLCLAAVGGQVLIHAQLQAPKNINAGDPAPRFEAGALTFMLD